MYTPTDNTFIAEKPRMVNSFIRADPHYANPLINNISIPATTRNQPTDYSFHSPNSNHDKSMMSVHPTRPDYPPDSSRIFRPEPSGIGNFPMQNNMSFLSVPRGNQSYHNRTTSNPLIMTNHYNSPSSMMYPQPPNMGYGNQNPFLMNLQGSLSPSNYNSPFSSMNEIKEDKMMKFFERQNAVIEKLAFRIQKEERDNIQKEKRELEQKLLNLQAEKLLRQQQEESLKLMQRVQSEKSLKQAEAQKLSKEKTSSTNLLEALGNLYLAQNAAKGMHQRSKSHANGLARNPNLYREQSPEPEQDSEYGGEQEEQPVREPPGRIKKESSFKIRKLGMPRLVIEDTGVDSPSVRSTKSSALPSQILSARDHSVMELDQSPFSAEKGLKKEKSSRKLKKEKSRKALREVEKMEDEEELKRQHEEMLKVKEKKKLQARKRLRPMLWTLVYGSLLFNDVKRIVEQRKEDIQNKMSDNIQMNFECAQNFLLTTGEQFLKDMVKESKNLEMYHLKKTYSASDLDSRSNFIFTKIKGFFDKLIVGTKTQNLPKNFLRFLASISENSGVLPNNFMFEFELKRLQFTHYATLKGMTAQKSKMIIGLFILIRVLIHKIIMRPWTVFPGIKKDSCKMNNLVTIGSILYHIVLDFYRGTVACIPNNQAFLPLELKIKPRSVGLSAVDEVHDDEETKDEKKQKAKDDKGKEPEPVSGFLSKAELKSFFVDRKKLYDQLKALVDGWLEKMYDLTHTVYNQTPKDQRETLGVPI